MSQSRKDTADQTPGSIDRRSFLTTGAAVAGTAAAISAVPAQAQETRWDREADVVIIGAGASGLPAAIAAREKGASVIMVEMNFDIGGRAMMSFGGLYIGGGNRLQKEAGRNDTPDLVFADWSRPEMPMGRFSDRTLVRTYADNNLDLFDWLEKHGIKWEGYRAAPEVRKPRRSIDPGALSALWSAASLRDCDILAVLTVGAGLLGKSLGARSSRVNQPWPLIRRPTLRHGSRHVIGSNPMLGCGGW